jgi:crotonobetainyl-CoA:carnitine CoA-transferase CaiB-like acyl-CoA transferase
MNSYPADRTFLISMSAFGQTGPFRRFIGYGPPAAALSGLFFATGYPGGEPCEIGISYPDIPTQMPACSARSLSSLH